MIFENESILLRRFKPLNRLSTQKGFQFLSGLESYSNLPFFIRHSMKICDIQFRAKLFRSNGQFVNLSCSTKRIRKVCKCIQLSFFYCEKQTPTIAQEYWMGAAKCYEFSTLGEESSKLIQTKYFSLRFCLVFIQHARNPCLE